MTLEIIATHRLFEGTQGFYRHQSKATSTSMRFAVYTPPQAADGPVPVVWFLSGLTCTEENFTVKAGAQRLAADLGLMLIAPDTSPRGEGVPDDPEGAYDFGIGAGFYVDATEAPWAEHYRMYTYITDELPAVIAEHFPADMARQSIMGHSMGGHGALTIALKNPMRFKAVSAFAPIASPINCPWGQKALGGYLGDDQAKWRAHDACALLEDGHRVPTEILVDQGMADPFLEEQLRPTLLEAACQKAGQKLTLRCQPDYDHSYYFIASFIDDHLIWHAERLNAAA
ncbi:S-formylglutathione hydrolase [Pedomonas mirosovicensis]|uniref:S-formylglutathione hydrolase n=1 Tax=Pedomonas mirosovicensis TaxID=2908641 RepID=UPI002169A092|nr:S-formylglutathione hydrolase [Pedomonas mirosovicensis]MCH8684734.1 S-formylglutathione hydrolase [Pedomonas mirosovicensis]